MKTELTIEESARLIELGVEPKLASEDKITYDKNDKPYLHPVFGLIDLLSILPKEIILNGKSENLNMVMDNYGALVGYPIFHETHGAAFVNTELIDSLYHLLIWAIEQGHLKTEKK